MKRGIHPRYVLARVSCGTCGTTFETGSTKPELHVEVCSNCHPFFTGKQQIVDTAGRVERFTRRYDVERRRAQESARGPEKASADAAQAPEP